MKHRYARAYTTALLFTAIAVACASQEEQDNFSPSGSGAGQGGSGGKGGSTGSSVGGSSAGGTTGKGGSSSGGTSTGGTTTTGGTTGGGSAGGGSGGGSAGDCSALTAGEGGTGGGGVDVDSTLHVEVKMDPGKAATNVWPGGDILIVNGSDSTVGLETVTLRYYLVSELGCEAITGSPDPLIFHVTTFLINSMQKDAADVNVDVVAVGANGAGCDAYVEISFDADAGSVPAGQEALLNFWVEPPTYTPPSDQSNDPSFGACTSAAVPWTKVTLYDDGDLVWGEEPYTGEGGAGGQGGQAGGGGQGGGGGAP